MEDKKLFKIGEVAKMFHISMGTLRHYEQTGLLAPEYVDEKTGYRYYSARQFEILNTIRYLRVLDIPLPQIRDFLQNRDTQVMEEKLVLQKKMIEQKQHELELIAKKIDHRLVHLRDAVSSELDQIQIRQMPPGRMVRIRDSLRLNSYLDLEYSIRRLEENQKESMIFLGKVGVGISEANLNAGKFHNYDMVFLMLDEEDVYEGEVEILDEQSCVTIRFCGSHREAPEYYGKMMAYIQEHHLKIDGFSREITLIDNGLTSDVEKFVTEIQIPVVCDDKI